MGRKYGRELTIGHDVDAVWAVLPEVLASAGFEIGESSDTDRTIQAKKRMKHVSEKSVQMPGASRGQSASMKATWGEKLEVVVRDGGRGSRVWVESRLVFGLIDWGENRKNVERIGEGLTGRLTQG